MCTLACLYWHRPCAVGLFVCMVVMATRDKPIYCVNCVYAWMGSVMGGGDMEAMLIRKCGELSEVCLCICIMHSVVFLVDVRAHSTPRSSYNHGACRATTVDNYVIYQGRPHAQTPMNTSPKELFTLSRLSVTDCSGIVEQEIINDASNVEMKPVAENLSELIYLPIQLANCQTIINSLWDSWSDLTVLAKGVIPQQHLQRVGR